MQMGGGGEMQREDYYTHGWAQTGRWEVEWEGADVAAGIGTLAATASPNWNNGDARG